MLLNKIANVNHVPYRGGAPLLTDFFGNHIPVASTPILPILQHAAAGTIVPLGVTSTERIPVMKDVPTFARDRLSGDERRDLVLACGTEELAGADRGEAQRGAPPLHQRAGDEAACSRRARCCRWTPTSPALTKYIAGEVKRWTAFVEEKGLKK